MSLTLNTLYDSLENCDALHEAQMKEILVHNKSPITSEIAQRYIDTIASMRQWLDQNKHLDINEKKRFQALFTAHLNAKCSSECKSELLKEACGKAREFKEQLISTADEFQKERDEHNTLRIKYNEQQKAKKIEIKPVSFQVSLKTKKPLNDEECVSMFEGLQSDAIEVSERFKRIPVPAELKDKVNRAYAKSSEMNNVIQKLKK